MGRAQDRSCRYGWQSSRQSPRHPHPRYHPGWGGAMNEVQGDSPCLRARSGYCQRTRKRPFRQRGLFDCLMMYRSRRYASASMKETIMARGVLAIITSLVLSLTMIGTEAATTQQILPDPLVQ